MDCPRCQTPNLPGNRLCIKCGAQIQTGDAPFEQNTAQVLYPPRKKDRIRRHRENLRNSAKKNLHIIASTESRAVRKAIVLTLLSFIIPGGGLYFTNQRKLGAIILATTTGSLMMALLLFRAPVSNFFLTSAAISWFYGIMNSWKFIIPIPVNRKARYFRLAGIIALTLAFILLTITCSHFFIRGTVSFFFLRYNIFPPFVLEGDRLLISAINPDTITEDIRIGDWLVVDFNNVNSLGPVIGFPGNHVICSDNDLIVDNQHYCLSELKIPRCKRKTDFFISEDEILIYLFLIRNYTNTRVLNTKVDPSMLSNFHAESWEVLDLPYDIEITTVQISEIQGIVRATILPTGRRRIW